MNFSLFGRKIQKERALRIFLNTVGQSGASRVFDAGEKMEVPVEIFDRLAARVLGEFNWSEEEKSPVLRHISKFVSDDVHSQIREMLISYGAARSVFMMCRERGTKLPELDIRMLVSTVVAQNRGTEVSELRNYLNQVSGHSVTTSTANKFIEMLDTMPKSATSLKQVG